MAAFKTRPKWAVLSVIVELVLWQYLVEVSKRSTKSSIGRGPPDFIGKYLMDFDGM